jgi:transposase-like protein
MTANEEDGPAAAETEEYEVRSTAVRRHFSAPEKRRILEEAEACTQPGEIGALCRREGIYTSYLSRWRRERDRGQMAGLETRQPGPKPPADPQLVTENSALRRENERLKARLAQAKTIIEVQKKLSELLGLMESRSEGTEKV